MLTSPRAILTLLALTLSAPPALAAFGLTDDGSLSLRYKADVGVSDTGSFQLSYSTSYSSSYSSDGLISWLSGVPAIGCPSCCLAVKDGNNFPSPRPRPRRREVLQTPAWQALTGARRGPRWRCQTSQKRPGH